MLKDVQLETILQSFANILVACNNLSQTVTGCQDIQNNLIVNLKFKLTRKIGGYLQEI